MSSPIAKEKKGLFDEILITFHKKVSHSNRVDLLSTLYINVIQSLNKINDKVHLLDIGCGDMTIAKTMASRYNKLEFTCIDIYPNKEKWDNYFEFDGKTIPFEDKSFDFVLFSDVLHHDFDKVRVLLTEAKRVSNYILIKDHFEYGLWSRRILQFADFIGNYGYGVSIPKQYFTRQSYSRLLSECKMKEIELLWPIQLYEKSSIVKILFKSKYQFLSIIQ